MISQKIMEKLASAGTIALLGYEVGSHINENDENNSIKNSANTENHDTTVVIFGIIILVIILLAILAKLFVKRPIVWIFKDKKKKSAYEA